MGVLDDSPGASDPSTSLNARRSAARWDRGSGARCRASSQHRRHISLRYSWTNWTTMEPSPTAEATRLIEPDRTSPAAKTPGRLVSSRKGWRRTFQCGESKRRGPVRTKSLASFSISGGSHSVEIRGHVLVQAVPTDHQVHLARVPGEIHGGLARGVAPAHYQHVRALAGPGLVRGCRIVH